MKQLAYQVRFAVPAFLGNAEQSGQWRTPPFKAQLRQWWRAAFAASCGFRVKAQSEMRHEEGRLFGHAWLEDDRTAAGSTSARKSSVRIRLDHWDAGKLTRAMWPASRSVAHPEVNAKRVAADLYLGYGPIKLGQPPTLKANAALQANEAAALRIACPEEHLPLIEQALTLMDRFGTVGGRSRNGWGSFGLRPLDATAALEAPIPLRNWKEALSLDWPHAVGSDETGALVWRTRPFEDWVRVMRKLATLKIGLRTQQPFSFANERPDGRVYKRHWLSYPVTKHRVNDWDRKQLRLPNSLRFKVQEASNRPGQLVGLIFHVPCMPPVSFDPDRRAIEEVWQQVHAYLDDPVQELDRVDPEHLK